MIRVNAISRASNQGKRTSLRCASLRGLAVEFSTSPEPTTGTPVAALTLPHSDVRGNNAGQGQHRFDQLKRREIIVLA